MKVYKQDAGGGNSQKPGGGGPLVLQCKLADPASTSTIPSAGWHLPTTSPVSYRLNLSSVPANVDSANLPTITERAFAVWSEASLGEVDFSRGNDTTVVRAQYDGQNIVAWGRTSGRALAVTYTWYNTVTHQAVETDTIFNSNVTWAWANQLEAGKKNCAYENAYDAQNILVHELGHWMGLDDTYTSEFTENTMFGYGSRTEVKKNTLTEGDITGIQVIY